jgi:prolyl oligopeptidase
MHGNRAEPVSDFFVASRERDTDWRLVFEGKKLPFSPILYNGRIFVFSYDEAANGMIVEVTSDGVMIRTVVPEIEMPPRQIAIAGGRFFASYFKDGQFQIRSWTLEGETAAEIDLPSGGTIQMLTQPRSTGDSVFLSFESFSCPRSTYEHRTAISRTFMFHMRRLSTEPDGYKVRELSCSGKDGTEIPITLVARAGVDHSRIQPVIMTSYGGFGVPATPQYSVLVSIMMEFGAAFALPHIRGGGERGKAWHDAGRARKRQTAIDDFISAAEWLCAEGITAPSKLAIFGGSNSGLLVAAAMTQRPDLFRAVLCIAPLLDMVRYEHFDRAARWQLEYGSADNAEDFYALHAYSPYHHVQENADYPATLFVSGDQDDRCSPAHVRKMAARLQERAAQRNPILVDYSAERGHSPTLPLSVRIDALARRLAFLCRELRIEVPQEGCHEAVDR